MGLWQSLACLQQAGRSFPCRPKVQRMWRKTNSSCSSRRTAAIIIANHFHQHYHHTIIILNRPFIRTTSILRYYNVTLTTVMEAQLNHEDCSRQTSPSPSVSNLSGPTLGNPSPISGLSGTTPDADEHRHDAAASGDTAPTLPPLNLPATRLDNSEISSLELSTGSLEDLQHDNSTALPPLDLPNGPVRDLASSPISSVSPRTTVPPAAPEVFSGDRLPHPDQDVIDDLENNGSPPWEGVQQEYPANHPLRNLSESWQNDNIDALEAQHSGTSSRLPDSDPFSWPNAKIAEKEDVVPSLTESSGTDSSLSPVTPDDHTEITSDWRPKYRSKPKGSKTNLLPRANRDPSYVSDLISALGDAPFQDRRSVVTIPQEAYNPFEEYRDPTREYRIVPPNSPHPQPNSPRDIHRRAVVVDGWLSLDGVLEESLNQEVYNEMFDLRWNLGEQTPLLGENIPRGVAERDYGPAPDQAGPSTRRKSHRESAKQKFMLFVRRTSRRTSNLLLDLSTRLDPKGKGRRNTPGGGD